MPHDKNVTCRMRNCGVGGGADGRNPPVERSGLPEQRRPTYLSGQQGRLNLCGSGRAGLSPLEQLSDEREQRQARDWVRRGFRLRNGAWGPAPDQGLRSAAGLVAWCLRERQARAA